MKLRSQARLELNSDDVCKLLTEAICTPFGMFEHMEVYRIERDAHGKFRVFMWGKQPRPVAKQDKAA